MDEKTEELRDIFVDVTETDTVTERQEEPRGSIAVDDKEIEDRLRSIVGSMDERYGLESPLSTSELVGVVRSFYAGLSDEEIAAGLDRESVPEADARSPVADDESLIEAVTHARVGLHLVTDDDREGPIDLDTLREYLDEASPDGDSSETTDVPLADIAAEFGVSESTARRYRRIVEVEKERKLIGDRFRREFEHVLAERGLSDRLTDGINEDGLKEATEDIETDVSF